MKYTKDLLYKIKKWRSDLLKSHFYQFGTELTIFLNKIEENPILFEPIEQLKERYNVTENIVLEQFEKKKIQSFRFNSREEQVINFYYIIQALLKKYSTDELIRLNYLPGVNPYEKRMSFIEMLVDPIVKYFIDIVDDMQFTLVLLEKYKRRVEWFTKNQLLSKYEQVTNRKYEQVFEDDLRLFLFDNGIEYPFSTPKSTSGRTDIVGNINANDPLIVEIKFLDKQKKYGKERISSGFSQIVDYTNDFNKNIGYFVIYNLNEAKIVFNIDGSINDTFPFKLALNDKIYFFIVIDLKFETFASNKKIADFITITKEDLFNVN